MNGGNGKRITRNQWLIRALELFAKTGEGGLRVEKLAHSLGVSKSGFYFHFKDREDFLHQLLDYWAHEYTEVITMNMQLMKSSPRERISTAMTMVFEQNLAEYDAAIEMWSRSDKSVARKRKGVIEKRLKFFRDAFEELGFKGDDLEMRTRVCAVFQMSERQVLGSNKKASEKYRKLRLKMLVSKKD